MTETLAFIENFETQSKIFEVIRRNLRTFEYCYMEDEQFLKLLHVDIAAANRVYVQELLFRTHFAALTTLFRNRRWMAGIDAALKHPNYFAFCACLRGFVESAADSHDALFSGLWTLVEHFGPIACALAGRFSHANIAAEDL